MPDDRPADALAGKKIRFTWNDGPTKGETHEHVFNADGSVDYRKVAEGPQQGKATHEKRYGAVKVTDQVHVMSYLGSAGYTLTVVLNYADNSLVGFASNDQQWFPLKGKFEEVE
jgi:phenolic acid decarboxylase